MGVILENSVILVEDGGLFTPGVTPQFGTDFNFHAVAREIDISFSIEMTDTKGAGDNYAQNRYHTRKGQAKLTGVVLATSGYSFKAIGDEPPIGRAFRITTVPSSNLTARDIYVGVCTNWRSNGKMGDAYTEDIELDLTPATN